MTEWLLRLFRLHDATPVERRAVLWTAALFFCVMAAYYLLRPLREQVGIAFGKENLVWLFTLTFVFIAVLNPVYMLFVRRLPTARLLPIVMHAFAGSFVVLAVLTAVVPPLQAGAIGWTSECVVAAFFYSWVTAFVVCGVALVWVHAVDFFTTEQGKRLFGLVAVGGTLGAISASAFAWVSAEFDRHVVMLVAAGTLEVAVLCHRGSLRECRRMLGRTEGASRLLAGSGALQGLVLTLRSPYLASLAGFVLLSAVVATAFYYTLNDFVAAQITEDADRRALFAQINLFQNLGSLVLQVWVTRIVFLRLGVAVMLCAMPAVSLLGMGLAAVVPVVGVFAVFEVLRRTLQFAFDKPARDVVATPLSADEKYGAKAFIDTAVLRFGDLAGAWLTDLLVRAKADTTMVALCATPVIAVWGGLGFWLGRQCQRREVPPPARDGTAGSS